MQAIHRFSRKKCIFRRTTYTSRRKIFEEKVAKRERRKEESRKKGHSEIESPGVIRIKTEIFHFVFVRSHPFS